MGDTDSRTSTPKHTQWQHAAAELVCTPSIPVRCPVCHAVCVTAAWHVTDLASRQATVDLTCTSCKAVESLSLVLPVEARGFYPMERMSRAGELIQDVIESITSRIRLHTQAMPAAAFATHSLWAEAKWSGTTFKWHPMGSAPPIMGLVFNNAEAGMEIFREAERRMNHEDRFEEIRVAIIEGPVAGQDYRPGYSIHISPDPDALAMHATGADFVVDPIIVPLLGQWNRHYPVPGMPALLPRFKKEFANHKEFLLAPVVKRADGKLYPEPMLGIIKNVINFRYLSEITSTDDPDAAAHVLPQLITPPR